MPQRPPPAGQLFDIRADGAAHPFRLHLQRQGQGRPAAVFDTGLSGNSLLWTNTLQAVAQVTEACAFDRAGSGWSDPPPEGAPRTSRHMVNELRCLLSAAGLPPPYVLAGHSAGAIHMLVFAKHYPAEVAGLVLVDPSHPEMFTRAPGVPGPRATAAMMRLLTRLRRLVGPLYLKGLLGDSARHLPTPALEAMRYFAAHGGDFAAAAREADASADSFADARGGPGSLGALPLRVLSAEWWVTGKPTRLKRAFAPLQKELAGYSTRGRHVIVTGCNHANLPVVRPDAVADAVREVIREAQA